MNDKLRISSPWEVYARQVEALFKHDPRVRVEYKDDGPGTKSITLYVEGTAKADALAKLLPAEQNFGGVTLHVKVVPANLGQVDLAATIEAAFAGNRLFARAERPNPSPASPGFAYAIFAPEAVQYWADNLGNPNGLVTQTVEELARNVLDNAAGCFCTSDTLPA